MTGTTTCNNTGTASITAGQTLDIAESGTIGGSGNPTAGVVSWAIGP